MKTIEYETYLEKSIREFNFLLQLIEWDSPLVRDQIKVVDNHLSYMKVHYNYTSDFEQEFNKILDRYYCTPVFGMYDFSKN